MSNPTVQIINTPTRMVQVFAGPRGPSGASGSNGANGADGTSFRALGAWSSLVTYVTGNAVTARSLADPSVNSLWIVKDAQSPAVGVEPYLDTISWQELTGGASSAGTLAVSQVGHGFTSIGQPVAFDLSTGAYEPADARALRLVTTGVVSAINDVDNFSIQFSGRVIGAQASAITGAAAWVEGEVYFLSSVPGQVQTAAPSENGYYAQIVAIALAAGATSDLLLILGTPSNASAPVVFGDNPPVAQREGLLWFRTDNHPGLYVSRYDVTETLLMWVQANG